MNVDWIDLFIGTVLGSAVTYALARPTARRSERGRAEEAARQRLLKAVESYQAQVRTALIPSTLRSAMDPNPLSPESRLAFAIEVEAGLSQLDPRTVHLMRDYLVQLMGPLRAGVGRRLVHVSASEQSSIKLAEAFMVVGQPMSDAEINDSGLLGEAHKARTDPQQEYAARDIAADKLAEMARVLRARH